MTDPAQPRRRAPWRPLVVAATGAAVLTTTVYGTFASAVVPGDARAAVGARGTASTGVLSLVMVGRGSGLTQQVSGLAPGDVVDRYVDVVAGGSLVGDGVSAQLSAAPSGPLTVDGPTTRALRAQVLLCDSGPWQPVTGACRGRTVELLAPTSLSGLTAPVELPTGRVAPGRVLHLRLRLQLPDQDETTVRGVLPAVTVQGQRALLTWTFRTRQLT